MALSTSSSRAAAQVAHHVVRDAAEPGQTKHLEVQPFSPWKYTVEPSAPIHSSPC